MSEQCWDCYRLRDDCPHGCELEVPMPNPCPDFLKVCSTCGGSGEVSGEFVNGRWVEHGTSAICPTCEGTGRKP